MYSLLFESTRKGNILMFVAIYTQKEARPISTKVSETSGKCRKWSEPRLNVFQMLYRPIIHATSVLPVSVKFVHKARYSDADLPENFRGIQLNRDTQI